MISLVPLKSVPVSFETLISHARTVTHKKGTSMIFSGEELTGVLRSFRSITAIKKDKTISICG